MDTVKLNLTKQQLNKFAKGMSVQLKFNQIDSGSDYLCTKKIRNKLIINKSKGKGMRINNTICEPIDIGSGININKTFKKLGKDIKKFGNNEVVDAIETSKKYIPKKVASQVVGSAGQALGAVAGAYMGNPEAGARLGKDIGVASSNAVYDTDFRKKDALKRLGTNLGQETSKAVLTDLVLGGNLTNTVKLHNQLELFRNGNPKLERRRSTPEESISNDALVVGGSFLANNERPAMRGRGGQIGSSMRPNGGAVSLSKIVSFGPKMKAGSFK